MWNTTNNTTANYDNNNSTLYLHGTFINKVHNWLQHTQQKFKKRQIKKHWLHRDNRINNRTVVGEGQRNKCTNTI